MTFSRLLVVHIRLCNVCGLTGTLKASCEGSFCAIPIQMVDWPTWQHYAYSAYCIYQRLFFFFNLLNTQSVFNSCFNISHTDAIQNEQKSSLKDIKLWELKQWKWWISVSLHCCWWAQSQVVNSRHMFLWFTGCVEIFLVKCYCTQTVPRSEDKLKTDLGYVSVRLFVIWVFVGIYADGKVVMRSCPSDALILARAWVSQYSCPSTKK